MKQIFGALLGSPIVSIICLVFILFCTIIPEKLEAKSINSDLFHSPHNQITHNNNNNPSSSSLTHHNDNNKLFNNNDMQTKNSNEDALKKYGLLEYRLAVCPLPDFVLTNTDLFNARTHELNIKGVIKYWRLLHKQMLLRYGSGELERALANLPSQINFDEIDQVFFELRAYILCLATAVSSSSSSANQNEQNQ